MWLGDVLAVGESRDMRDFREVSPSHRGSLFSLLGANLRRRGYKLHPRVGEEEKFGAFVRALAF